MFALLHPALVHFPIALLIFASGCALLYLHWRPLATLKTLTWWTLFPGWLSLLLAIISGILAQGGLAPDAPFRGVLNLHITTGLVLVIVYGDLLYRRWLHRSGKGRKRRPGQRPASQEHTPAVDFLDQPGRKWWLTLQLLVGILLVVASGYLGGELVYTWGVNVRG